MGDLLLLYAFLLLIFIGLIHNWSYPNAPYKHFFNLRVYTLCLVGSAVFAVVSYHWLNQIFGARLLFEPLIFLILFKLADWLSLKINKRHIYLMLLRNYEQPHLQPGENIVDFLLDFLITTGSFALCFLLPINMGI